MCQLGRSDWEIPLGRRFRALKLYFVLKSYGAAAIRQYMRETVAHAAEFEKLILEDGRFEMPVPRTLGLVCFRLK